MWRAPLRPGVVLIAALTLLGLSAAAVPPSGRGHPAGLTSASTSSPIAEFPIPSSNSAPSGIVAGADGNLWFTEGRGNKIGRITTTGSITEFAIPTPDSAPLSIALGPDGNLWFTETCADRIGRITPAGVVSEFVLPPSPQTPTTVCVLGSGLSVSRMAPTGIVAGPDGNVWFVESGADQVGRMTPSGAFLLFLIPCASYPQQIASGPKGELWFTVAGTNQIGIASPSGVTGLVSIPTPASFPWGIAVGPDGNLWFTELEGNKVGELTISPQPMPPSLPFRQFLPLVPSQTCR